MYKARDSDVQTCAMKAIAIFKNLRQQWCQCLKMDNDMYSKMCDNSDIEASNVWCNDGNAQNVWWQQYQW